MSESKASNRAPVVHAGAPAKPEPSASIDPRLQNPKLLALPLSILVAVGRARLTVKQLLDLEPGAVVDLDSRIDDPAEIFVGDRLIAQGELVETDAAKGGLGLRITKLCETSN